MPPTRTVAPKTLPLPASARESGSAGFVPEAVKQGNRPFCLWGDVRGSIQIWVGAALLQSLQTVTSFYCWYPIGNLNYFLLKQRDI
jgi:hypothetical protein